MVPSKKLETVLSFTISDYLAIISSWSFTNNHHQLLISTNPIGQQIHLLDNSAHRVAWHR